MGLNYCLLALCACLLTAQGSIVSDSGNTVSTSSEDETTPMVAFLCGKPAMHLTPRGWVKDENTDCLKDPVKILEYCKQMYPNKAKQINNVVEASRSVKIDNWCRFGRKHCSHHGTHQVRPFKCLVGPFQSEALLVPNHCVFDHIHKTKECKSFQEWNKTALESCRGRGMVQQSCAILLPCGVNVFGGVEFVCCPQDKGAPQPADKAAYKPRDDVDSMIDSLKPDSKSDSSETEDEDSYWDSYEDETEESDTEETEEEEEDDSDYYDDDSEQADEEDLYSEEDESSEEEEVLSEEETESEEESKEKTPPVDAYTEYLHKPNKNMNEHDYFFKAKAELQKHHHEKVTKMMKEWAAARQRVQDMKATDQKAADKLNKEITIRFQKTYQALEQEGQAEKKQLVALHQQRVQADMNERKRHAMEHYMSALQKPTPDAAQILKALQHYIKTEQKDRMHTINHLKHLRETDPAEAESVRGQTEDHLAIIDQRIQQSIQMLNRVPGFAKKIKVQIEDFMKTFREIDMSIHSLLDTKPVETPKVTAEEILEKYRENEAQAEKEPEVETEKPKTDVRTDKPEVHKVDVNKVQPALKPTNFDDEVMEDEHDYIKTPHISNARESQFGVNQPNYVKMRPLRAHSFATGSGLGVAIACIAVFVVIVIGIIVLRKRTQRVPLSHGFVEQVDQAVSPEERHVTNMQINGYENPTYKYFEMNGNGTQA